MDLIKIWFDIQFCVISCLFCYDYVLFTASQKEERKSDKPKTNTDELQEQVKNK